MSRFIEIVEVGPRDGLQNEKAILDPEDKLAFIRRLEVCGARRIEAVSFVNESAGCRRWPGPRRSWKACPPRRAAHALAWC